ncbi:MAG: WYL domain-containing protein [archaeon]
MMDFDKEEILILLKSIKIMENGEALLGIDIERDKVNSLIKKLSKSAIETEIKEIDNSIESLIKEAEEYRSGHSEEYEIQDFDDVFGPSYPYSDTMKILKEAIESGKCVEINYYSANQGKFTKRKVRPESIERDGGVPYLNAYCFLRNDKRVFKLGRIKEIRIVD